MHRPLLISLLLLLLGTPSHAAECSKNSGYGDKPSDLDILAGQHVVYSYPNSSQPPEALLRLTRAGLVGGVILFRANIDNGTAAAMRALTAAYRASPAPGLLRRTTGRDAAFLITTDQEGGRVRRIADGEPVMSAKKIGAAADAAGAGAGAGRAAAGTLREYGVNVNLAPVLDVYRRPGDFEDFFERSFGNTSEQVSRAAIPFITAQQAAGVAATAKHFPGLGPASHEANTDEQAVTLTESLHELQTIDMVPYHAALAAGVDLVMPSWAIYPALDATYPAGLSSKWIKQQLRGELGFRGVTISDAMEAGSLAAFGDAAATAKLATKAGMDILLASSRNVTQGVAIREALVQGLRCGELDGEEFKAATQRIAELRSKIPE
ncbi:hypothetical protein HRG_007462 [Hirsutella rhossiliensis]|uniref:Glycoside hydrolase family 3 N-terminal domain-containing protein n=1 Tax=Hirsutella rhossiliensis TaxID=111463 RepID=A0A9P8SGR5_9HYPO|nr:uncharacterized protein HRG_07462 [Hirsutella rhossiliensis]KAH0961384.1 hypothetical protein HRG_07462 [Hirsutella rhossiliensis]